MRKNVLPNGCDLCYMQFESKNFGGLRARAFDSMAEKNLPEGDGRFTPLPKMMEFEISNVCNLECTMCNGYFSSSIRKHREHLPPLKSPYDQQFASQLEPFIPYLKEAKFLGGEPFLIKTYYQIWDLIVRLNPSIQVSITTNGTVLTRRVEDILEALTSHIIVSIDSLQKNRYERIRVNAHFDHVMENLLYFGDYTARKNTSLTLAVCPMRQNWQEMPAFLQFCNARNIGLYFNTVTFPEDSALSTMTAHELSEVIGCWQSIEFAESTERQKYNNSNYCDLIRQVIYYRDHAAAGPAS